MGLAVTVGCSDPVTGSGATVERPPVEPTSSSSDVIIPIGEPTSSTQVTPNVGGPIDFSSSVKVLSAYGNNECWLVDGAVRCHDDIAFAVAAAEVDARFTSLSLGEEHLCGLDSAGLIQCFGEGTSPHDEGTSCSFNDCGQSIVPPGSYKELAAADQYTCGLRLDGSIDCWGEPPPLLTGTYTDIDAYASRLCGLTTDSRIVCNDASASGLTGTYTQLAVGPSGVCGVTSGAVHCSGLENQTGDFARISVGGDFACGLRTDGSAGCWGAGLRVPAPAGHFSAIASGLDYACASTGGEPTCWGEGRGDGGATLQCGFDQAKLSGTLSGATVETDWRIGNAMLEYGGGTFTWDLDLNFNFDDTLPGVLLLSGDGATSNSDVPRFALDDGQSVAVMGGVLLTPSDAMRSVYCVGAGTANRVGDEVLVDFPAVAALGSCPGGEPVVGEVRVCVGFGEGCGSLASSGVSGTLDAVAFETELSSYLGLGRSFQGPIPGGAVLWTEERDYSSEATSGAIRSGLIFTDPAGPHQGAIYCAGDTSQWEDLTDDSFADNTLITLSGMSRLGSCLSAPAGSDHLSGCIR